MDPKLVKELVKAHRTLEELYTSAAHEACRADQPWEVYQLMKDAFGQMAKVRRLENRYGKV